MINLDLPISNNTNRFTNRYINFILIFYIFDSYNFIIKKVHVPSYHHSRPNYKSTRYSSLKINTYRIIRTKLLVIWFYSRNSYTYDWVSRNIEIRHCFIYEFFVNNLLKSLMVKLKIISKEGWRERLFDLLLSSPIFINFK